MSSESLASDQNSSNEAVELKESRRRSDGSSDSGSKADTPSTRARLLTQAEAFQDEFNDSATSFLNSSDENNHEVNFNLASWLSLKDLSFKAFTKSGRLSSNNQKSTFTGKASSLERPTAIRRVSSMSPLEKPSTKRYSSLDSLEVSLTKGVSSLDPLERPPIKTFPSLHPLEGPSTRKFSSLDPLEGPSTRKFLSLDPLEGQSSRRFSSLDPLEGPSSRRFPSLDSVDETLARIDSISDPVEDSLTCAEREANESIELTTEQNRFLAWLKSFLRRSTRQFRNSVFYPLFLVTLLALPISAGYMGCNYRQLCDGCRELPLFVYSVGLLGMFAMSLQVIAVIARRYFSPPLTGHELDVWLVFLCFPFGFFLVIEAAAFYLCEPIFVPPNAKFCLKVFYNYAYYANIGALLVLLLLMLIHIPGCTDPSESD